MEATQNDICRLQEMREWLHWKFCDKNGSLLRRTGDTPNVGVGGEAAKRLQGYVEMV